MVDDRIFYYFLGAIAIISIPLALFAFGVINVEQGSWVQEDRGIWVKNGNPLGKPDYVLEQQKGIACAMSLYDQFPEEDIFSQCLGSCDKYAVDFVHVPRIEEDDLEENLCESLVRGQLKNFIELDREGNIVRISE